MGKNAEKKISKKFSSFTEEEKWLQTMLQEGWVLSRYSNEDEDGCQYVFRPVEKEEEKRYIIGLGMQRHANGGQNIRAIEALEVIRGDLGKTNGGVFLGNRVASRLFNNQQYDDLREMEIHTGFIQ
jgi:predicted molibdopterin-dependent oxidoreductase YjgC